MAGAARSSLLAGALAMEGADVTDLGILPTPGIARIAASLGADLAIVISASHNPPEFNGLKLLSCRGTKLPTTAEHAVEEALDDAAHPSGPTDPGPVGVRPNAAREYADWLRERLPGKAPLAGLRLAIDAGEGAASDIAEGLFSSLGADVLSLSAAGRGAEINVGTGALHPERVARIVAERGLDAGIAFDGDADRALFADARGTVRDGDDVLAILAPDRLETGRLPNRVVVGTTMSNQGLDAHFRRLGIRLERAPVGDRWVFEWMTKAGASLGGEPSGHIVFLPEHSTGDGIFTALMLLEAVARRKKPLAELADAWTRYPQALIAVAVVEKPDLDGIPAVRSAIEAAKAALADRGRLVVRYSGTEPLARVMVEGEDRARVEALAKSIAEAIRVEIGTP